MVRRLLLNNQEKQESLIRKYSSAPKVVIKSTDIEVRLRNKRSPEYVKKILNLDTGGVLDRRAEFEKYLETLRTEFPEIPIEDFPVGIVAKCHLGSPYEVHTLDCLGKIIEHYKTNKALPGSLEQARSLALHPAYAFIEVYNHKLIAVSHAGTTSIISL